MMKKSYDIKDIIIEEVKKISLDISLIESVIELINNYHKVQSLYEKVTFLKILTEESINTNQIRNELKEIIKFNTTLHYKSEEVHNNKKKITSVYKTKKENNESFIKKTEFFYKKDNPLKLEKKENVFFPKMENIIENYYLEDYNYVNTFEENEEKKIINLHNKLVNISKEYISEVEKCIFYKNKVLAVEEKDDIGNFKDYDHGEHKLILKNLEETTEKIDKIVEIKGKKNYPECILTLEDSETQNIIEEKFVSKKVNLSTIKEFKSILIEKSEENISSNEEDVTLEKNNIFSPINLLASFRIRQLRLDLNDKIAFLKKLFSNNHTEMKIVIEKLNEFQTIDEAKVFFTNIYHDKHWKTQDEYAQRLWLLVESRFRS